MYLTEVFPHSSFVYDINIKNDRDETRLSIRRKLIAFGKKVVDKSKQRLHMVLTNLVRFFSKGD